MLRESTRRLLRVARSVEEWRLFLGAQVPGDEGDETDQQDDPDEDETDEKRKKEKDKKDKEDSEDESDEQAAAVAAHSAREAVARSIIRLGAKARNEPEPEFIPGPAPRRVVRATARMFDEARKKRAIPTPPVAPRLDDPDPTYRAAAAILAAAATRERVRVDPPLPDKKNSAALYMIRRTQERQAALKEYRKNGIVR